MVNPAACRAEQESEFKFKAAKEACRIEAEAPTLPSFPIHPASEVLMLCVQNLTSESSFQGLL